VHSKTASCWPRPGRRAATRWPILPGSRRGIRRSSFIRWSN